MVQS
jgi:hypothetical protein